MEREIAMNAKQPLTAVMLLVFASTLALGAKQEAPSTAKTAAKTPQVTPQSDGERVFKQQCSRCHTPPDGFSTHISGTIVRHMRVRASLSQDDEKALLRYFNP
jgi:mono/diheme cytochrome c family protein